MCQLLILIYVVCQLFTYYNFHVKSKFNNKPTHIFPSDTSNTATRTFHYRVYHTLRFTN
jgi:hypothetical protein